MIGLQMAPAERAEQMTGRPSLSFSSISTMQNCPLKWYFRYVVGLPEETKSASLVFGSAIHSALQRHFEALLAEGTPPALEQLVEEYRHAWASESDGITFGKGDSVESLDALAVKMLRVFQVSDLAAPHGQIVAIEEELIGEISPDCTPLLARLDLAVESDEAITITDFKTSRSRWSHEQAEDSATQLLVYRELAGSLAGGKPIRLQFGVLAKTKEPSVEIHPVADNPRQVDRVRRIIERVWRHPVRAFLSGTVPDAVPELRVSEYVPGVDGLIGKTIRRSNLPLMQKGGHLAKNLVIEVFQVEIVVQSDLTPRRCTAIRRTLDDKSFHTRLRRAATEACRDHPSLRDVRVRVSR